MFMLNSNEPIKVADLQKLANRSMLNDAFVIEMENNSFNKSKKNFDKVRHVLIETNRDMGSEKYISNRFC